MCHIEQMAVFKTDTFAFSQYFTFTFSVFALTCFGTHKNKVLPELNKLDITSSTGSAIIMATTKVQCKN